MQGSGTVALVWGSPHFLAEGPEQVPSPVPHFTIVGRSTQDSLVGSEGI